jgi:hypothetical protein
MDDFPHSAEIGLGLFHGTTKFGKAFGGSGG